MVDTHFYVSPHGSDQWSGRLPEPAADLSDGPLRTLVAAQAAVCMQKAALSASEEIYVWLRGGCYELEEPWRLTASDAGFGRDDTRWPREARTWPVHWAAYEGETPVISGGQRIAGPWELTTIHGREAWKIVLPEVRAGEWYFRQLWVNGERRARPRLPKKGLHQTERAFGADYAKHGHMQEAWAFGYHPGAIDADWTNLSDVELHFFGWWLDRWVKIREVDVEERIVTFDRDAHLRMAWAPNDGIDYVVDNVFEALTEPGEWYLDRPTGTLYYLPLSGESPDTAEVIAPRLEALLQIEGAGHLRFEGLNFAHTEWTLPDDLAGSMQAALHVPAAIRLSRVEDCVFSHCRIEHVGTYGAEVRDNSVETIFDHCTFRDLGAGGVKIWHGCRRNAVLDCEIGDGGHIHASAVGVLIGKATGNRVEHCHIHDFYYTGISVGWNWGYTESDGYGNIIEWNHIHDIGKGLLSDMGGIYLLGHAAGTRLRFNHIHDIACRRYGGWCIYTDEGSTDVLIESNLCYRANRTAFNQHYGRNNLVRNNILAYGDDAVLSYGHQEAHRGLIFERNILLSHGTPILREATTNRWTPQQAGFSQNLYWCETGPVVFERGKAAVYGSQPFPDGFLAEIDRFSPLEDGLLREVFVTRQGHPAPAGVAEVRMSRQGTDLLIHAEFQRPQQADVLDGLLWNREHVELFLKPFPNERCAVQLGLASDGASDSVWHGCTAPAGFIWDAQAEDHGQSWQAMMRIPLAIIADAIGCDSPTEWSFLVGFATLPAIGDFASWQAQGHDPEGVVADPQFADPADGDFRLAETSPALRLGFVPFDLSAAGPRTTT